MLVTPSGIVTLLRKVRDQNVLLPMLVMVLGIVTVVRKGLDSNAPVPMLVTGRPLA